MASKGKILVVDDERDVVSIISLVLEKEGFTVFQAYSGEEALSVLSTKAPDLVLADIRLPGMDGNTLLKRIKEFSSDVPVIMITAFADVDNAITSLRFGADDFIKKPFENSHLVHIVKKSLDAKSVLFEKRLIEKKYSQLLAGKSLRPKEAKALGGLVGSPNLSDREIAGRIDLPRTTLTGIKNRLKKDGFFRPVFVPDFGSFGFDLLSVVSFELDPSKISGDFSPGLSDLGCVVFSRLTDLEGFFVCALRDYTAYKLHVEPRLNELSLKGFFKRLYVHHFPLELTSFVRFFDFSHLIDVAFDLGQGFSLPWKTAVKRDISKSEFSLARSLCGSPGYSDSRVAGEVGLSRARVSQIKKGLLDDGLLKSFVLPDVAKLGFGMYSVFSMPLSGCSRDEKSRLSEALSSEPSCVLCLLSDSEFLSFNVLWDYSQYRGVFEAAEGLAGDFSCVSGDLRSIILPAENLRSGKLDFSSFLDVDK